MQNIVKLLSTEEKQVEYTGTQRILNRAAFPQESRRFSNRYASLLQCYYTERCYGTFGGYKKVASYADVPSRVADAELAEHRQYGITNATIRLQLDTHLTFQDVAALAPLLKKLHIDGVYVPPFFSCDSPSGKEANPYSISNPALINPALGGAEGFEAMCRALEAHGLKMLIDLVPNHMSARAENNRWWADVLKNGKLSLYWDFFEMRPRPDGTFVIPRLGDPVAHLYERGELCLGMDEHGLSIHYYENRFPLSILSYKTVLALDEYAGQEPLLLQLKEALVQLEAMNPPAGDLEGLRQRNRQVRAIDALLRRAYAKQSLRKYIESRITLFNRDPEDSLEQQAQRFAAFQALLDEQNFILKEWYTDEQHGYGHFFDIKEMVKLNINNPRVRNAYFAKVFEIVREHSNLIGGVRLDHIDGPLNAEELITWLYNRLKKAAARYVPIYVEKILGDNERIPETWRGVEGETGYRWLNAANSLYIDPSGFAKIKEIFEDFTGKDQDLGALSNTKKREVLEKALKSDVAYLSAMLYELARGREDLNDIRQADFNWALMQLTANLPQYRTYFTSIDVAYVEDIQPVLYALAKIPPSTAARNRAVDYLADVLFVADAHEDRRKAYLSFVMRWQQMTGPAMAKGVEDAAFPNLAALKSRCEVGLPPGSVQEQDPKGAFHSLNSQTSQETSYTMVADASHDTKQGAETRLHNDVLAEPAVVDTWARKLAEWECLALNYVHQVDGEAQPDAEDRYIIYQTIASTLPYEAVLEEGKQKSAYVQRLQAYMEKWMKEAGRHIDWSGPKDTASEHYLEHVMHFIDALFADKQILRSFGAFREVINFYGSLNALANVVLKMSSPSIPDIYQLGLLTDFSLVDPDNRRPVDWKRVAALFQRLEKEVATSDRRTIVARLLAQIGSDELKLYTNWQALLFRQRHIDTLLNGRYEALSSSGRYDSNIVAFMRSTQDDMLITIAPRITSAIVAPGQLPVGSVWQGEVIQIPVDAPARWRNALTGEVFEAPVKLNSRIIYLSDALRTFPAALLEPLTEQVSVEVSS